MDMHGGSARGPAFLRRCVRRIAAGSVTFAMACGGQPVEEAYTGTPVVNAADPVAAGRYIVTIGGCNDCHTDGFAQTGGNVPESDWLTGSVVGFRGPWGTTYPANLRLSAQSQTEDQWVEMLATRTGLPPMPWVSVNAMSDGDRRAIYRYLRAAGPAGVATQAALPPGTEPTGPWIPLEPPVMPVVAGTTN